MFSSCAQRRSFSQVDDDMDIDCAHLHCDKNTLQKTLARYGAAIIPNVLDTHACSGLQQEVWRFFETITADLPEPLLRNNPNTWKKAIQALQPLHGMLFQWYGVGQAKYAWDVRTHPEVVDVFAKLWDCTAEDLLVSFDGVGFQPAPETTGIGWHRNDWLHVDQSYTWQSFCSAQAWVTALDVRPGDATLTFLEGSHLLSKDFAAAFPEIAKCTDNWHKFSDKELLFYGDCIQRNIVCPAGSMVVWDSRTVHAGRCPSRGRETPNERCVVYVSYQPRAIASKTNLAKKIVAYETNRTTCHLASAPKLFPKGPRRYGNPEPPIRATSPAVLTPLGRRLAGYDS